MNNISEFTQIILELDEFNNLISHEFDFVNTLSNWNNTQLNTFSLGDWDHTKGNIQ